MNSVVPMFPDTLAPVPLSSALWLYAYAAVLVILALFGFHRLFLVFLYYRNRHREPQQPAPLQEFPHVTVQLPIYNERYVVSRLLDAVSSIDYPREKMEIQVLDDSTDDTLQISSAKVQELKAQGWDITLLHRENREGYKAGALSHGMKIAKGDFLAIFDADFVPNSDFLKKTLPHFTDPGVGAVQTRWEHLNRNYSVLTQVEAMLLDAHFVMEHTARSRSGRFINFNGTAGIWRRQAIEASGGWSGDTLTEDLDLSMRAQMQKWRIVYLRDVTTPGELPVEVNGFKGQQHRWTKGAVQTTRKLLWPLLISNAPLKAKVEATIHLFANFTYVFVVLLGLLMLPATIVRGEYFELQSGWFDAITFLGTTMSVLAFFIATNIELGRGWLRRLMYLPHLVAIGFGMSLSNAVAVLEALFGYRSSFVRTPKFNLGSKTESIVGRAYRGTLRPFIPLLEILMAAYFAYTAYVSYEYHMFLSIPFCAAFMIGFFYLAFLSFFQGRLTAR